MIEINDSTVGEFIKEGITLLFFNTNWCPHCKPTSKSLKVLDENIKKDKFKIGDIDVDTNPLSELEYKIDCYPTLVLVKDSKSIGRIEGILTVQEIKKFIAQQLKTNSGYLQEEKLPPSQSLLNSFV